MEKFAFILHPLSLADMEHLSPLMKYIPGPLIESRDMRNLERVLHLQASLN